MEQNPPKVNKWDIGAIKNALDDGVKDVFSSRLNYLESHKLVDGRLFISLTAVAFSLFAMGYDHLYSFPLSRLVLLTCSVAYFILMCILTWYTSYVEKGIFCVTIKKDVTGIDADDVWNASSSLKRFDHFYHLTIEQIEGNSGRVKEAKSIMAIEHYFDSDGKLIYDKVAKEVIKLHNDIEHKKN